MKTSPFRSITSHYVRSAFAVAIYMSVSNAASGAEIVFTIDPGQSTIAWGGTSYFTGPKPFIPQSPGSLSTPISGHFLVDFDPTTSAPSSLSFVPGHGYFQAATPYTASPGVGSMGPPAPANVAGTTTDGILFAVRNLSWDLYSPTAQSLSGGSYAGNQTWFTVLSGGMDSVAGSENYSGNQDNLSGGQWTLSESNGTWTLAGSLVYNYGDTSSAEFAVATNVVSTAYFAPNNLVENVPSQVGATEPIVVQTLGSESGTTGGVAITLPPLPPDSPSAGVTSVEVQAIPDLTGVSQAAIEAAQLNSVFAASLESVAEGGPQNLQIWNVHPSGFINGTQATLVFNYDPNLFTGIDQSKLGIWHFNKIGNFWEFGGSVDVANHTITYTTTSFSEFVAGVPEPSSMTLAGAGLAALAFITLRKRRAARQ